MVETLFIATCVFILVLSALITFLTRRHRRLVTWAELDTWGEYAAWKNDVNEILRQKKSSIPFTAERATPKERKIAER